MLFTSIQSGWQDTNEMKKRTIQILFLLIFIAVVIGLMSGSIHRQALPLYTILLILITGMDFYLSGKSLERVIAWFAVWLEAGWEILFLIKDSVEWLSLAAATLEKLSFFILMFFFLIETIPYGKMNMLSKIRLILTAES